MDKRKNWTDNDVKLLKTIYSDEFNKNLIKIFNRSEKAIQKKANKLNLKKSKTHKSKCIAKRNKSVGRDITIELIKKESIKYKTKSEFAKKDPGLYSSVRRLKCGDEVFSHMIKTTYSLPQLILLDIVKKLITDKTLYNTRSIIKPYELDIFLPEYKLTFEYDGVKWHKNNKNDKIKNKLCKRLNIVLIRIKENNRNYEADIKKQFINYLPKINKVIDKPINKNDITQLKISESIYNQIYNKDELLMIAKKYNSFREFISKEKSVYKKLIKLKLIDLATTHMTDRRRKRSINEVKDKVSKYVYLSDLIKNDYGTYLFIKKNKLNFLLKNLKTLRN